MNFRESFSERFESFIGGKGFYIVLFASIAIIGVTAWLVFAPGAAVEEDYMPVIGSASDMPEVRGEVTQPVPDFGLVTVIDPEPEASVPVIAPAEEISEPAEAAEEPVEEPETITVSDDVGKANDPIEPALEPEGEAEAVSAKELVFSIPVAGDIKVSYSPDALVYNKTMGDWRTHEGIDVEAPMGTKVKAVAQGKVMSIEEDDLMGTVVRIDHGNGLVSIYANLAATPAVREGDAVAMGAVIGSVGDTALGEIGEVSHLHFAMEKNGEAQDPFKYIPKT